VNISALGDQDLSVRILGLNNTGGGLQKEEGLRRSHVVKLLDVVDIVTANADNLANVLDVVSHDENFVVFVFVSEKINKKGNIERR